MKDTNNKSKKCGHSVTVMSLFGKVLLSKPENFFEVIKGMDEACIVDTHVDWASLSAKPENTKKAYILGTTFDKEHSPIWSVYENSEGRKIRYNTFIFGMRSPAPEDIPLIGRTPRLWILRLDEHCFPDEERDKILEWEQSGRIWNDSDSIKVDKQKILGLLGVRALEDLKQASYETKTAKAAELKAKISSELPKCFKDFIKSIEVARFAYASLLLDNAAARNDFSAPDNRHVLGDMQLVQNALFWGAKIISNDNHVRWMAKICHIQSIRYEQRR